MIGNVTLQIAIISSTSIYFSNFDRFVFRFYFYSKDSICVSPLCTFLLLLLFFSIRFPLLLLLLILPSQTYVDTTSTDVHTERRINRYDNGAQNVPSISFPMGVLKLKATNNEEKAENEICFSHLSVYAIAFIRTTELQASLSMGEREKKVTNKSVFGA